MLQDAGGAGCLEAAAFADTLVDFETQESEAPVAETQVVEAEAPVAETRVEAKAPEAETRVVEADAAEAPEEPRSYNNNDNSCSSSGNHISVIPLQTPIEKTLPRQESLPASMIHSSAANAEAA